MDPTLTSRYDLHSSILAHAQQLYRSPMSTDEDTIAQFAPQLHISRTITPTVFVTESVVGLYSASLRLVYVVGSSDSR